MSGPASNQEAAVKSRDAKQRIEVDTQAMKVADHIMSMFYQKSMEMIVFHRTRAPMNRCCRSAVLLIRCQGSFRGVTNVMVE